MEVMPQGGQSADYCGYCRGCRAGTRRTVAAEAAPVWVQHEIVRSWRPWSAASACQCLLPAPERTLAPLAAFAPCAPPILQCCRDAPLSLRAPLGWLSQGTVTRPQLTRAWPLCMSRCVWQGFRPMLLLLRAVLGLLEQLPGAEPAGVQVTAKSTCRPAMLAAGGQACGGAGRRAGQAVNQRGHNHAVRRRHCLGLRTAATA